METLAVVMQQPGQVSLSRLGLPALGADELVVDVSWSGISTGTERLLWSGKMPPFPGMGYPLVPGYETVGIVSHAAEGHESRVGDLVFVSGARCYGDIRGLFGGAASRLICSHDKAITIAGHLQEQGILMALAATAYHAMRAAPDKRPPELIVGHGVLGRLLARLIVATGHEAPVVWELDEARAGGAVGYPVLHPDVDKRRDYQCICDVSGDVRAIDSMIARLARGGELILGGFYADPVSFDFPPAFMRETRINIAAEWQPADLAAVVELTGEHKLSLDSLLTHRLPAESAAEAYNTAFSDPSCLKMILDWSAAA
ncbi:MAG: chlorophyll synthesis pathway protein BchC [Pseudomonadota bacterium]